MAAKHAAVSEPRHGVQREMKLKVKWTLAKELLGSR